MQLLTASGALVPARVCADCASRAVRIVIVDERARRRSVFEPYAAHLKRLAKAYDMNGDGRALGLLQAAELLEAGRIEPTEEPAPKLGPRERRPPPAANGAPPRPTSVAVDELTSYQRALLHVLKRYGQMGRSELAFLAGYSPTSGSYNKALGLLRASGLLSGLSLTAAGDAAAAAAAVDVLPEGGDLVQFWCERVGEYAGTLLQIIVTEHPGALTRDELAERAGYSDTSGSFNKKLGKLRKLDLVARRALRASDALMAAVALSKKGPMR